MKKHAILSIRQPWAWAIIHGYKPVENRTWYSNYTGPLLIHAGKVEDHSQDVLWEVCMQTGEHGNVIEDRYRSERALGAIVGSVEMRGCTNSPAKAEEILKACGNEELLRNWWQGPYGFILSDPVAFRYAIPQRGRLGIWWQEMGDAS